MVQSVQELLVYQKAVAAADAISSILKRPEFARDFKLRDQLASSSGRVVADIREGFGQSTDRKFAQFLSDARGSSAETQAHLTLAQGRDLITEAEREDISSRFDEIQPMLTGLGKHLRREDRRDRGYGDANGRWRPKK